MKLIIQFLIGISLLAFLSLAQTDSPMGKYSDNPSLADIFDEVRQLSYTRPDLSQDELVDLAIKRAYEKKRGLRI